MYIGEIKKFPNDFVETLTSSDSEDMRYQINELQEERRVMLERIETLEKKICNPSEQSQVSCCRTRHIRFIPFHSLSNIPLLTYFLLVTIPVFYLIISAFTRLHKEVSPSFSSNELNIFPNFTTVICPIDADSKIFVSAYRYGNHSQKLYTYKDFFDFNDDFTTNFTYDDDFNYTYNDDIMVTDDYYIVSDDKNDKYDPRMIVVRKGDPKKLVGGYIPADKCYYVTSTMPLKANEKDIGFDTECIAHSKDPSCLYTANFGIGLYSPINTGVAYAITSTDSNVFEFNPEEVNMIPVNFSGRIVINMASTVTYTLKKAIKSFKLFLFDLGPTWGSSWGYVQTDEEINNRDIYDANYSFEVSPEFSVQYYRQYWDINGNYAYSELSFYAAACNWKQTVITEKYAYGYYEMFQSVITYLTFFGAVIIVSLKKLPSSLEVVSRTVNEYRSTRELKFKETKNTPESSEINV